MQSWRAKPHNSRCEPDLILGRVCVQNVKERRNSSYKCIYRKFSGSTSAPPHREAHHVDFKPSLICASSGANFPPSLYLPAVSVSLVPSISVSFSFPPFLSPSPFRCRAHRDSFHFFTLSFFSLPPRGFIVDVCMQACMHASWFTSADVAGCFIVLPALFFFFCFLFHPLSFRSRPVLWKALHLYLTLSIVCRWILEYKGYTQSNLYKNVVILN